MTGWLCFWLILGVYAGLGLLMWVAARVGDSVMRDMEEE